MKYENRSGAGRLLAEKLREYNGKEVVVYALPRGGVVTAYEIAKALHAPLELVIVRKIGHPNNPEYAVAAVSQNGTVIVNRHELGFIDEKWFDQAVQHARSEVVRRKKIYIGRRKLTSAKGKIAILVDDGVATGLTLKVGIKELKRLQPTQIVVAVPMVSATIAFEIRKEVDALVALAMPSDDEFLGAISSYYERFDQVEDSEVIEIMAEHGRFLKRKNIWQ